MQVRRRNRREWAHLAAVFGRSGYSMAEYCAKHGLVERTFGWWRWRLGSEERSPTRETEDVRLVPIDLPKTAAPRHGNAVQLALAGIEIHVEVGTDVAYVAALVAELRSRC